MGNTDGTTTDSAPTSRLLDKNEVEDMSEGKAWEQDALNRKPAADYLTRLVASIRQPFVVSVDAPYGGGKTYFLKNWKRDLDSAGYLTAYFNVWETDYSEDPLLPFMASISRQFEDMKDTDYGPIGESALKKIRNKGPKLIAKTAEFATKSLIRRVIGNEGLEAVKYILDEDTKKELLKEFGGSMENVLRKRADDMDEMVKFRGQLKDSIRELTEDLDEDRRKLIVLVDELDRCRPDYAVKVLERIKHFFAVPGMVVILGIAEKQVAQAMSAVYGAKLDTEGYLRRFIDWRFQLPQPTGSQYVKSLGQQFGLPELKIWKDNPDMFNSCEALLGYFQEASEALGISLRQQEQIFTEINLYLRTLGTGESPYSCVVGFLAPLRSTRKDLFAATFAPQALGEEDLSSARKLFATVKEGLILMAGNDYSLSPNWRKVSKTEAQFLTWFSTERNLTESSLRKREIKNNDEYEECMWHRYDKLVSYMIEEGIFLENNRSLAMVVRERLDHAGEYLLQDRDS